MTACRCTACCGHVVSCIKKSRSAVIMNLYLWQRRYRTCEVGPTHVGTSNKCNMKISALNLASRRARVKSVTSPHAVSLTQSTVSDSDSGCPRYNTQSTVSDNGCPRYNITAAPCCRISVGVRLSVPSASSWAGRARSPAWPPARSDAARRTC